nr:unnamed protein product [Callosobruchus chinensis]
MVALITESVDCIRLIRANRLINDPALTCHLQPLSHRRAVGDLQLFYRCSNGFCSSELTSIIPPLAKSARCTHRTSSHPKARTVSGVICAVVQAKNCRPLHSKIKIYYIM